jgi:hypothetical protein
MLGAFTSYLEMMMGMGVSQQVLLEFVLEFLHKVVYKAVAKVFTTKVGVTGGSLNLKDALLNSQEGHIKGSSTQIKNQYIPLSQDFLVQSVCNGSGSRLIDDTQNVETGNCASILCGPDTVSH